MENNTISTDLWIWSHEISGARKAILRFKENNILLVQERKDKKIYSDAIYNLILSSKENTESFLLSKKIGFRNHRNNKAGKLISCEAYFIE